MFLKKLLHHFNKVSYPSALNEPIHIGTSFGKRAIFAGEIPQSGGEFIHEWNTVIKSLKEKSFTIKDCLMLGVAGGDGINALRTYYPGCKILGVEIDPVILDIALKNNFFKVDDHVKVIENDAIQWMQNDKQNYDLIIVDVYVGLKNVPEARQETFLKRVRRRLSPHGVVLFSCHYDESNQEEYTAFIALVKKLYNHIEVVFEYPKNKILLFSTAQ